MASYLKQRLLVNVGIGSCEPPQPKQTQINVIHDLPFVCRPDVHCPA